MSLQISPDKNLYGLDISELKIKLENVHNLIIKVTDGLAGTDKSYSKNIIKIISSFILDKYFLFPHKII